MILKLVSFAILGMAFFPSIYYLIVLYSSWQFFRRRTDQSEQWNGSFTPPVSNLKPVRGLDPDAYENFASFCQQDYPEYEIVFCIGDTSDPAYPILNQLIRDFPDRQIRILIGSGREAPNDKVAKLARMSAEAKYETLVISDSDVRVRPDYLRSVVAPLRDPKVGAVTCMYVSCSDQTFTQYLQSIGMISDFFPGILVARQFDGVKFALGPTIVTTRRHLEGFGGYRAIENRPGDDLLVGRLIEQQGLEVVLLRRPIETVADFSSLRDLVVKRLRWMTVMRHMRPWGHLGLIFTQGLLWTVLAVLVHPTVLTALLYFGLYACLRIAMTASVGSWGLQQKGLWKSWPILPVWDATALFIWLVSFTRRTITWRKVQYRIREGVLVPVGEQPAKFIEQPVKPSNLHGRDEDTAGVHELR
jgi:ceramide glucosyltransferase